MRRVKKTMDSIDRHLGVGKTVTRQKVITDIVGICMMYPMVAFVGALVGYVAAQPDVVNGDDIMRIMFWVAAGCGLVLVFMVGFTVAGELRRLFLRRGRTMREGQQ